MSFRSRIFSRNTPVTARFAPVYAYKDTGVCMHAVEVVHNVDNERLFQDTTFDKVLDSGLSPRQFKASPDSCLLNKEIAIETDASALVSELQYQGVINRNLEFVKPVADVVNETTSSQTQDNSNN